MREKTLQHLKYWDEVFDQETGKKFLIPLDDSHFAICGKSWWSSLKTIFTRNKKKLQYQRYLRILHQIETEFVDSEIPGASRICDCALFIRESLEKQNAGDSAI